MKENSVHSYWWREIFLKSDESVSQKQYLHMLIASGAYWHGIIISFLMPLLADFPLLLPTFFCFLLFCVVCRSATFSFKISFLACLCVSSEFLGLTELFMVLIYLDCLLNLMIDMHFRLVSSNYSQFVSGRFFSSFWILLYLQMDYHAIKEFSCFLNLKNEFQVCKFLVFSE